MSTLNPSMLLTQQDVTARIVKLGASAAEVQSEIHLIACSTLDHIRVHGDTTGAVALMNALPKGQRVKSLSFWFRHFSNGKVAMALDKATDTWSCTLGKKRTEADFDIVAALAMTFADLTTEREPVSMTLEQFIKGLERTANNTANHDGTEIPKVSEPVRALAAKLNAYIRDNNLAVAKAA